MILIKVNQNNLMTESATIKKLFKELLRGKLFQFPKNGYVEALGVPNTQGVYIIYNSERDPAHVGRTVRGKNGLCQRLNQHLLGQSSFVDSYSDLKKSGRGLRGRYWFRCLEVPHDRERALLESLATGLICPEHLGLSLSKKEKNAI